MQWTDLLFSIEQFAQKADLKKFLTSFRKDLSSSTTFSTQTLDGGENTQSAADAGIEAVSIISLINFNRMSDFFFPSEC
jgi:hypothetical protein